MLASSLDRILSTVGDDAVVLDIGGWARPLTRADWVVDLMPYETRGLYGRDGAGEERFGPRSWVRRDICDHEPYPFEDGAIDFVVCSHTLEDVRDPVWVCSEMNRVAKAGYIEVPSRLEEQSYGVHGPWVGWSHHHWLIDVSGDEIEFVFKPHVIHARESDHFPAGYHRSLTLEERVQTLWWEGRFGCRERVMTTAAEVDPYLSEFVAAHQRGRAPDSRRRARSLLRRN